MTDYTIPIGELFVHSSVPLGIPGLATDELRIAFLQATEPLCPDVQRKIWEEVLYCTTPIEPPPAPQNAVRFRTIDRRSHYPETYSKGKIFE